MLTSMDAWNIDLTLDKHVYVVIRGVYECVHGILSEHNANFSSTSMTTYMNSMQTIYQTENVHFF